VPDEQVSIWIRIRDVGSAALSRTERAFKRLGISKERLIRIGKRLGTVLVATVAAGLVAATRAAARFSAAMAEVGTLLDGDVRKQTQALGDEILNLSRRLPKDPNELGAGLYQVLSAGISDTTEAIQVLEVATKAAVGGIADTFTAVDAITGVLNAYNLEADRATQVSDVMFQTVKGGKINFTQLASEIGTVAPTASLLGISFEEIGAAVATMTKANISAAETMSSLNRLLLSIVSPSAEAKAAAAELGVEWSVAGLRAHGFQGLLAQLEQATQGNITTLQRVVPDLRSFRAAAVIAGTGAEEFAKQVENMRNATGAAEGAFEIMNREITNLWQRLKNRLNIVLIEAGTVAIPALADALERAGGPLAEMETFVEQNTDAIREFSIAVGQIGTAVAQALIAIGKLTVKLGDLLDAWNLILNPDLAFSRPQIDTLGQIDDQVVLAERLNALGARRLELEQDIAAIKAKPTPSATTSALAGIAPGLRLGAEQRSLPELEAEFDGLADAIAFGLQRLQRLAREQAPARGLQRLQRLAREQAPARGDGDRRDLTPPPTPPPGLSRREQIELFLATARGGVVGPGLTHGAPLTVRQLLRPDERPDRGALTALGGFPELQVGGPDMLQRAAERGRQAQEQLNATLDALGTVGEGAHDMAASVVDNFAVMAGAAIAGSDQMAQVVIHSFTRILQDLQAVRANPLLGSVIGLAGGLLGGLFGRNNDRDREIPVRVTRFDDAARRDLQGRTEETFHLTIEQGGVPVDELEYLLQRREARGARVTIPTRIVSR
jgi:TP901 family phage tail tape measure protein